MDRKNSKITYKGAFKFLAILFGSIVGLFILLIIVGLVCSLLFPVDNTSQAQSNIITKAQYGEKYPYTIDKLKINCKDNAVWLEDNNGDIYALNGLANAKFNNNPKLKGYTTEISKDKPLVDDSFIMNRAFELCN